MPSLSPSRGLHLLGTARLALDTEHQAAIGAAVSEKNSYDQLMRLAAAIMRDLEGMPQDAVVKRIQHLDGFEHAFADTDFRAVRRVEAEGRLLWARLGAWPWVVVPVYDEHWRLDADVIETWLAWRDPSNHPRVGAPAARVSAARAGHLGSLAQRLARNSTP